MTTSRPARWCAVVERWWWVASRTPDRLVLKVDGLITADGLQGLPDLIGLAKELEILVRLDCRGGNVATAREVQRALDSSPARVVVRIEGRADSATGWLLCAADEVQAVPDAGLLIHAPHIEQRGNARLLRALASSLEGSARELAHLMARKSGRSVDDFLPLLLDGEDHDFTAHEARDLGLVDVILSGASA